jgi:hypothetical protein
MQSANTIAQIIEMYLTDVPLFVESRLVMALLRRFEPSAIFRTDILIATSSSQCAGHKPGARVFLNPRRRKLPASTFKVAKLSFFLAPSILQPHSFASHQRILFFEGVVSAANIYLTAWFSEVFRPAIG